MNENHISNPADLNRFGSHTGIVLFLFVLHNMHKLIPVFIKFSSSELPLNAVPPGVESEMTKVFLGGIK